MVIAHSFYRVISIVSISLVISLGMGCIPLPTRVPDPEPFSQKDIGFLVPGESSREQVLAGFWNDVSQLLPMELDDGHWWIYTLPRGMWQWGMCNIWLWEPALCPSMSPQSNRTYYLLLEFDSFNVLKDLWVTDDDGPCKSGNLCKKDNLLILSPTPRAVDSDQKQTGREGRGEQVILDLADAVKVGLDFIGPPSPSPSI